MENITIKTIRRAGFILFAAALLGSCVKDELYNTPHPDKGAVRVTTDWSGISEDAVLPESYLLRIGETTQNVSAAENTFKELLSQGSHSLLVHNQPHGITVGTQTATVNTLADGTLEPMPDYLFSAMQELNVQKDDTLRVNVKMMQAGRKLTLVLKFKEEYAEHITSSTATLSGIAHTVDLATGKPISDQTGGIVIPAFVKPTVTPGRSAEINALVATVQLAGVVAGEPQLFKIEVSLDDGSTIPVESNLTETLKNFDSGNLPLTITITITKAGLSVSASEATEWTGTTTDVESKELKQGFAPSDLKIGDYYYSDGNTSDGGYRVYADESNATLPIMPVLTDANNQPRKVVGIVYWVGDITNNDPLLKKKFPNGTKGLVVALQDAGSNSYWSSSYEDITISWLKDQGDIYVITSLKEENKMQGYANTQALKGYNASDRVSSDPYLKVLPIEAITTYAAAHPTPASSSGWYWPSLMELQYMCWGQGNSSGTAGREFLDVQFEKVSGTSLQLYNYWSSTEYISDRAWNVYFYRGDMASSSKRNYSFAVRAVAAF